MWVFKVKGETYYVDHAVFKIGFSTKETPDNPHTKGSLKTKGNFEIKEENGKMVGYVFPSEIKCSVGVMDST